MKTHPAYPPLPMYTLTNLTSDDDDQDEQDSLRSYSEEDMLTWQDYKAMPFTQCVSHIYCH